MSQLFASGGQSTGVSASASALPMNTQDWSPLGWTGWISLQSKGLSRVFSNTTVQKHQFASSQIEVIETLSWAFDEIIIWQLTSKVLPANLESHQEKSWGKFQDTGSECDPWNVSYKKLWLKEKYLFSWRRGRISVYLLVSMRMLSLVSGEIRFQHFPLAHHAIIEGGGYKTDVRRTFCSCLPRW